MDATKSRLAELLFKDSDEKSKLLDKVKSGSSIIGSKVNISGKKYVISDGNISKIIKDVSKIRNKYPRKK